MSNISPLKLAQRIRIVAVASLLLMPLAALGTRFELWHFSIGLAIMGIALASSLLIQIINAVWLFRRPTAATKRILRSACFIALPPLIIIASVIRHSGDNAMIHNISTNIDNPPTFIAAIDKRGEHSNDLAYTADIAAIQQRAYPEVHPIISTLTPEQAYNRALTVAKSLGWQVYYSAPEQNHIEAVDTTFWFGFKDDIVIKISTNNSGSRIDLRSVSRVGKSDLGANAKRIIEFATLFQST